jgi:hypothetical protein
MQEKRASNLTEFIYKQTKDFRDELQERYLPSRLQYFHAIYAQLAQCYHQHITPLVQQQLDSAAMLEYYSCYKRTLRTAKDSNKKLYEEGLRIEVRLKQCIEIKSSLTKSTADFENDRKECYDDFAQKYDQLYADIFTLKPKQGEAGGSAGEQPKK